jgi:hypothetical protein
MAGKLSALRSVPRLAVPEFAVTVTDSEDLGPNQNLAVNLNKVLEWIKSVGE